MERISLSDHLKRVRERRAELEADGVVLPTDEALRNKGKSRTPEKRELLDRIEARAIAAGRPPIKSYR